MSELDEKINDSLSNLSIIDFNELNELMKSKTTIMKLSKTTDPYLAVLSIAKRNGCDKRLRALIEDMLASWLDENPKFYEDLKQPIKLENIMYDCYSYVYEAKINALNYHFTIIKNEISKYLNGNYYYGHSDNGVITELIKDDASDASVTRVKVTTFILGGVMFKIL